MPEMKPSWGVGYGGLAGRMPSPAWDLRAGLWRWRGHWSLALYPDAREATGSFQSAVSRRSAPGGGGESGARSRVEAARRAQGKLRRYCAANGLNRLGTLTYAGEGCHDPFQLRTDVAEFFTQLRKVGLTGGRLTLPKKHHHATSEGMAYVWVPQWHPGGHGLHVHFAVGRYVDRSRIEECWPHGFVHIKLLSGLSTGSGWLEEARLAARYLSRYIGEQLDDHRRSAGLHRYEVAQGFQPRTEILRGHSAEELIEQASRLFGARPSRVWHSQQSEDWHGPPACWLQWR